MAKPDEFIIHEGIKIFTRLNGVTFKTKEVDLLKSEISSLKRSSATSDAGRPR